MKLSCFRGVNAQLFGEYVFVKNSLRAAIAIVVVGMIRFKIN